jgi:transposase
MSSKETERIAILESLMAKCIKQEQAAQLLNITARQVRRILRRYKEAGPVGLAHRGRRRKSNRAISEKDKERVVSLIEERYPDFGPTLAHEKLVERHEVNCSIETVRQLMIGANLWQAKKRTLEEIHSYRERRACVGELIQLDGSPHAWFEERAKPCTLLAFIDDATSRIMDGEFVDYEGTFSFFEATEHYLVVHGKPLAFYVDKHSTFKVNRQATVEEELKDCQPQSQFARAMGELGVTLIFAHSPQAKGRIERLFGTLQDRLIKEMRLEGVDNQEKGTQYFREVYIPQHNRKFAVTPREKANLHRPLLPGDTLADIFTVQLERVASKQLIVQFKNKRYQLKPPEGYRYSLRKARVTVSESKEGEISFFYKGEQIPFTIACQEQPKENTSQIASAKSFTEGRVYIPAPDHPWRRSFKLMRGR